VDTNSTIGIEDRMSNWVRGTLDALVGDQPPGNAEPSILFRCGYAVNLDSATHCNYAGTDCWRIKTHPMISHISADEGYTSGGQLMVIHGYGLNGTDPIVMIDGVACEVQSNSAKKLTCVTGASSADSTPTHRRPGSPGI
jgi:hypothetical protein